jgi:SAM-dependent methyltransferase
MNLDYDLLAADYARHRTTHPGVLERLVQQGRITHGSRILDVGCGTGNYAVALVDLTGCEAWGLEPSDGMRGTAQGRLPEGRVHAGQAERLEVPGGPFDLVFSVDVIHHVGDRPAYHREAFRVLKRGGRFCTVTDSEEIIRHRAPLATHFPETVEAELKRYPPITELRRMMEEAGFAGIEEETVSIEFPLTDVQKYRDKAYSSLHLISEEAFGRGMARLERDLRDHGSVAANARYTLLWGTRP